MEGVSHAVASAETQKREDVQDVLVQDGRAVFAVFDGHGGRGAADACKAQLVAPLLAGDSFLDETKISDAHWALDQALGERSEHSGSTTAMLLVERKEDGLDCLLCWCGDSSMVRVDMQGDSNETLLWGSAKHSLSNPREIQRLNLHWQVRAALNRQEASDTSFTSDTCSASTRDKTAAIHSPALKPTRVAFAPAATLVSPESTAGLDSVSEQVPHESSTVPARPLQEAADAQTLPHRVPKAARASRTSMGSRASKATDSRASKASSYLSHFSRALRSSRHEHQSSKPVALTKERVVETIRRMSGAKRVDEETRALIVRSLLRENSLNMEHPPTTPSRSTQPSQLSRSATSIASRFGNSGPQVLKTLVGGRESSMLVTRSVGDWDGPRAIVPQPEFHRFRVHPDAHERVIIASDGLWDLCSYSHAASLARRHSSVKSAASALVSKAKTRSIQQFDTLKDDTTVIVIDLNPGKLPFSYPMAKRMCCA